MLVCALDLEMAQPSNNIIEIGYTIGDPHTGEVKLSKGLIVNPHELLSEFIINLTSIDQKMVDEGQQLVDAYQEMMDDCKALDVHRQPVVWGGGDVRTLIAQVRPILALSSIAVTETPWAFGYTEMNIKNIVQGILGAKKYKTQGGLGKSLGKFDLNFQGTKHRAKDDSLNTFLLYVELLKRLQVVNVKAKG